MDKEEKDFVMVDGIHVPSCQWIFSMMMVQGRRIDRANTIGWTAIVLSVLAIIAAVLL